jgi:hypothetical protein
MNPQLIENAHIALALEGKGRKSNPGRETTDS